MSYHSAERNHYDVGVLAVAENVCVGERLGFFLEIAANFKYLHETCLVWRKHQGNKLTLKAGIWWRQQMKLLLYLASPRTMSHQSLVTKWEFKSKTEVTTSRIHCIFLCSMNIFYLLRCVFHNMYDSHHTHDSSMDAIAHLISFLCTLCTAFTCHIG